MDRAWQVPKEIHRQVLRDVEVGGSAPVTRQKVEQAGNRIEESAGNRPITAVNGTAPGVAASKFEAVAKFRSIYRGNRWQRLEPPHRKVTEGGRPRKTG
jgi:hypothetical protein